MKKNRLRRHPLLLIFHRRPSRRRLFELRRSNPQPNRCWNRAGARRASPLVLAIVALAEAGIIAWWATRPAPTAPAQPAATALPVTIASGTAGDVVTVDGRQVGVTPFQLNVDSGVHEVRITSSATPPSQAAIPALAVTRPRTPAEVAPPVAATRSGGIRFSSPIEVQVLEGEQVLGSSNDGPIVAPAGVHALDLVNSAFGYRERRLVEFKAGQVIELNVTMPDGRLNVNAVPWAQVWIDGKESGETPLANVTLPAGSH